MTQAELREQWEARIKDYRTSGLTAAKWCAKNQVTTRQLWYWLRKLRESKEKTGMTTPNSPCGCCRRVKTGVSGFPALLALTL